MENLIFSLNATIPIFLMMVLGVFFRKTGLLKENMINGLNQFVFKRRDSGNRVYHKHLR